MDASVAANLEQITLRKVYLHLIPYSFVIYILCYVDRINVSFAALTMNRDIGLTAHIYGLTAGAFFWGYCLLEVPSNIILQKVGARIWIARIMISWGLLSAATALVTGPVSFFIVRVLLGAA
jgi:ACS family tartrate transporter-like MFS transporter